MKVCGENAAYGLTELKHPAGTVWLAGPAGPLGGQVRIIVKATDVVLATRPPHDLSVRSSLRGQIGSIEKKVRWPPLRSYSKGRGAFMP